MRSQTIHQSVQKSNSLRRAMRSNGIFSGLSGLVMLLDARPLSRFLGLEEPVILGVLGAALLFYAAALIWVTSQPAIHLRLAQTAIALDIGWVIGSVAMLLSGWPNLTTAGNWTVALLAEAVATFALWQAYALRRLSRGS